MFKIKFSFLFFFSVLITHSFANTDITILVTSGNDDLRGGNRAYFTVNFTDGTTSPEYSLNGRSEGIANNNSLSVTKSLTKNVTELAQVRNIVVRYDGSPRAGQPFDTYDNWALKSIRVSFTINGMEQNFINDIGTPLVTFTGQKRNHTFVPKPPPVVPDARTNSKIKVYLTTGSDDLRGGNNAFIILNYRDGSKSPEYRLGGGFRQNSLTTKTITANRPLPTVNEVSTVTIRHDGAPRAGQPVDTYDNWDVQALRVVLIMPDNSEINIINSNSPTPTRFTGQSRIFTWTNR